MKAMHRLPRSVAAALLPAFFLCFAVLQLPAEAENDPLSTCKALSLIATKNFPPYIELAISRDGANVAFLTSAPGENVLHLVGREDEVEKTVRLPLHNGAKNLPGARSKIEFSPDGNWLAVASGSELWGVSHPDGKVLFNYSLGSEPTRYFERIAISNISVAAEIRQLNSNLESFHGILWLDREGKLQKSLPAALPSSDHVSSFDLSPNGESLAMEVSNSANKQSGLRILDPGGSLVSELKVPPSLDVRWLEDGKTLLLKGSRIEEIDARTGKSVGKSTEHLHSVEQRSDGSLLETDPEGQHIAALFYHYNPLTRVFDMGPEDPGWEFRLYRRGSKHALCRSTWISTGMRLTREQLIVVNTRPAQNAPVPQSTIFVYRILDDAQ